MELPQTCTFHVAHLMFNRKYVKYEGGTLISLETRVGLQINPHSESDIAHRATLNCLQLLIILQPQINDWLT